MNFKIKYAGVALLAALLSVSTSTQAQDISCNSTYTTERGDSLSEIAKRAYDNPRAYQSLFDVNPGVLTSPNVVPIGADLFIPCLNAGEHTSSGRLPEIRDANSQNIKILTGKDYAPYVGQDLPEGGFSTELIHRAMQFGGQPANYLIRAIGDWSVHLSPLLEESDYDIAYPWFKPDCNNTASLGDASVWRCDNLLWSRPLHEIVVTFYGRAGEVENISSAEDARGMTLCRPAGYFTHDLEAAGLVEPTITRVKPATPEDCFEMLAAREVDLVSVNSDTSDRIIQSLGMEERTTEVIDLSTIQTLHAVGMRTNPQTRIILRRIDKGLKSIQESGQFREVAANHL
ncbi:MULTISPECIES: transporter substrate-binding domain-containing protein [Halomonadaceae]|uniref:transporter substrate-binding domain-containing protein n=1 Tax=Halomonadaceae TaxID=28256 RepID=UPI001583C329|nr:MULTISPECIES: transporter substrate-binding domain-containing protein [Halomonas]MDI4636786.1 transporter substrate-binding domain-containing protein [Halomonas sp. BMC7]NUJ61148.1 transporter substrate-binding domain-containing protein [Halomonas taeanensis]